MTWSNISSLWNIFHVSQLGRLQRQKICVLLVWGFHKASLSPKVWGKESIRLHQTIKSSLQIIHELNRHKIPETKTTNNRPRWLPLISRPKLPPKIKSGGMEYNFFPPSEIVYRTMAVQTLKYFVWNAYNDAKSLDPKIQ